MECASLLAQVLEQAPALQNNQTATYIELTLYKRQDYVVLL